MYTDFEYSKRDAAKEDNSVEEIADTIIESTSIGLAGIAQNVYKL